MIAKPLRLLWIGLILSAWLNGCGREADVAFPSVPTDPAPADTVPWVGSPDNATAMPPVLGTERSIGSVTTYGGVSDSVPSSGGACNYGATGILNYAAIDVNMLPGDALGQWQGGRICGQCAQVEARTAEGIKTTVVRIVDKCPDANCGIDLGGRPAKALMGDRPGRYSGAWKWVSCEGQADVSDGAPSLFVKEGSNPYWALVQVRNPPGAVLSMAWSSEGGSGVFAYATEAENFFKVPQQILGATGPVTLAIAFSFGSPLQVTLSAAQLAAAGAVYPLE
ncbi:MAG: expansin-like protein [Fibrobacteria bacterium]